MTSETDDSEQDSDEEESPATPSRATLPNHKLTIALVGLAVGFIILIALNMN